MFFYSLIMFSGAAVQKAQVKPHISSFKFTVNCVSTQYTSNIMHAIARLQYNFFYGYL